MACVAFDGHIYMYKSARCLANWHLTTEAGRTNKAVMQRESRGSLPLMSEWKEWLGVVEAGHFWTTDLAFTRRQLMEEGISPKVTPERLD